MGTMTRGRLRLPTWMGRSMLISRGDAVVVAADADHEEDEQGNDEGGDPGAVLELGDEDDEQGDAGGGGSYGVDEDAVEVRGPGWRIQCTTMPACERVKARKAPMAKSGMRRSVTPPKTMSSRAEKVTRA